MVDVEPSKLERYLTLAWDFRIKLFPTYQDITIDIFNLCHMLIKDDRVDQLPFNGITELDKSNLYDFIYRFFLNFGLFNLRSNSRITPNISSAKFNRIVQLLMVQYPEILKCWNGIKDYLYAEITPNVVEHIENDRKFNEYLKHIYDANPVIFNPYMSFSHVILDKNDDEIPMKISNQIPINLNLLKLYTERFREIHIITDDSNTPISKRNVNSRQIHEIAEVILPRIETYLPRFIFSARLNNQDINEDVKVKVDHYFTCLTFGCVIPLQVMKLLYHLGGSVLVRDTGVDILTKSVMEYNGLAKETQSQLSPILIYSKQYMLKLLNRTIPMEILNRGLDIVQHYTSTIVHHFMSIDQIAQEKYISESIGDLILEFIEKLEKLQVTGIPLGDEDLIVAYLTPGFLMTLPQTPPEKDIIHHNYLEKSNLEFYSQVSQLAYQNILIVKHFARRWGLTCEITTTRSKYFDANLVSLFYGHIVILACNVLKVPFSREANDIRVETIDIREYKTYIRTSGLFHTTVENVVKMVPDSVVNHQKKENTYTVLTGHSFNGSVMSLALYSLVKRANRRESIEDKVALYTFGEIPWLDQSENSYSDNNIFKFNRRMYRFLVPNDSEVSYLDLPSNFPYHILNQLIPIPYDIPMGLTTHSIEYYRFVITDPAVVNFSMIFNPVRKPTPTKIIAMCRSETHSSEKYDENDFFKVCFAKHNHQGTFPGILKHNGSKLIRYALKYYTYLASPNSFGKLGKTALHVACEKDQNDSLKSLLEVFPDKDIRDLYLGQTPLHIACAKGHDKCVTTLLEAGADKNAQDKAGRTPLMLASDISVPSIVKILMEKNADRSIRDVNGHTCYYYASEGGHFDTLKVLDSAPLPTPFPLDYAPNVFHGVCALPEKKALEWVEFLLDKGYSPKNLNVEGETCIFNAAQSGNLKLVRMLFECGVHLGHASIHGETALHRASQSVNPDLVEYIVNQVTDKQQYINQRDNRTGEMALDVVISKIKYSNKKDGEKIVNLLSEFVDTAQSMALVTSVKNDNHDMIRYFTTKGFSMNIRAPYLDSTILHRIIRDKSFKFEILKRAIEMGADYNQTDFDHKTILHYAVSIHGTDDKLIEYLVNELHMNVNAKDSKHKSPIHYAVLKNKLKALKIILKFGSYPDFESPDDNMGRTPLMNACLTGHFEQVKFLLKHTSYQGLLTVDKENRNILHFLFKNAKSYFLIDYLLQMVPGIFPILIKQLDVYQQSPVELMVEMNSNLKEPQFYHKTRSLISKFGIEIKNIRLVGTYQYMAALYRNHSHQWYQTAYHNGNHKYKLSIALKYISNLIEIQKETGDISLSKFDQTLIESEYHRAIFYLQLSEYKLAYNSASQYLSTMKPDTELNPIELEIKFATKLLLALIRIRMEPVGNDIHQKVEFVKEIAPLFHGSEVFNAMEKNEIIQDYHYVVSEFLRTCMLYRTLLDLIEKMLNYNSCNWQARFQLAQVCLEGQKIQLNARYMLSSLVLDDLVTYEEKQRAYLDVFQNRESEEFVNLVYTIKETVSQYNPSKMIDDKTVNIPKAIHDLKEYGCTDEKTLERVKLLAGELIVVPGEGFFDKLFVSDTVEDRGHKCFYRINKIVEHIDHCKSKCKENHQKFHLDQLRKYYIGYMDHLIATNNRLDTSKFNDFEATLWESNQQYGGRLVTADSLDNYLYKPVYNGVGKNVYYHKVIQFVHNPEISYLFESLLNILSGEHKMDQILSLMIYEKEGTTPFVVYSSPVERVNAQPKEVTNLEMKKFSEFVLTNLLMTPGFNPALLFDFEKVYATSGSDDEKTVLNEKISPYRNPMDINFYSSRMGLNQILTQQTQPNSLLAPDNLFNMLFALPQMKEPIHQALFERLAMNDMVAEEMTAKWLFLLHFQANKLEGFRDHPLSHLIQLYGSMKLTIKMPRGYVCDLFKTLKSVSQLCRSHFKYKQTPMSHVQLLELLYPTLQQYVNYSSPRVSAMAVENRTGENSLPPDFLSTHSDSTLQDEVIDFFNQIDFSQLHNYNERPNNLISILKQLNFVTVLKLHNITSKQLFELLTEAEAEVKKLTFTNLISIELYNPVDLNVIMSAPLIPTQLIRVLPSTLSK
ncbi:putative homeobox transcription factor [Tieghemostelium lacteum]|uniref:Putative homeobox transcription factor n=1 Tax=Tieghemostelium lacteum TaxID=361077 RepID=A0A152A3T5_TIELA|nr:putative homeobox transcription factor [Tieghemostelium lacteum]|eukprot:KYR00880.1 putative homeobox transcription factor [Tieghemostelium lacteum]